MYENLNFFGTPCRFGRPQPLSIDSLEPLINKAFLPKKLEAVFLSINSPGGSPVQSELIVRSPLILKKYGSFRRIQRSLQVPITALFFFCHLKQTILQTQACLWACGRGDVSTPSFGSHLNPIPTRGGRLCSPYTGVHTKF